MKCNLKRKIKAVCFLFSLSVVILMQTSSIYAYFNRGKEQLSLATTEANVTVGETFSISVNISPESYTGLPGCGLAQCPTGCLESCEGHMNDNNGQCQCGGYTPQTANASLSIQVGNTAIASANYSSGVLTVIGLRAGKTQITVQATLWEHENSDPQVIDVTVTKKNSSSASQSGEENSANDEPQYQEPDTVAPGDSSKPSQSVPADRGETGETTDAFVPGSQVEAVRAGSPEATGEDTSDIEKENPTETHQTDDKENEIRTVNTPMAGVIQIVTLHNSNPTGKSQMEDSIKNNSSVTFQKLDSGQKVLYSWTFQGKDIKNPKDIPMEIDILTDLPSVAAEQSKKLKAPLYLSFVHQGDLPGKAKITVSVGTHYQDGQILSLYYLNEEKQTLDLSADNLEVKNGYVDFELEHCSDYVLTTGLNSEEKSKSAFPVVLVLGIGIPVVIIVCFCIIWILRKKKMR